MAWRENSVMDERFGFIVDWLKREWSMAELCRRYGISRKTGYKLVARFVAEGRPGLSDRNRAPLHQGRAVSAEIDEAVVEARACHPSWGPKKLRAFLGRKYPGVNWPAQSTIGLILRRHGLTVRRRHRGRASPSAALHAASAANEVWGMDFKGWFRTGDGQRCDPFSLSDLSSRYLLRLQAVDRPDGAHVWPILEAAFYEYGLPRVIRSDNGAPFASIGAGGLSNLAVKLVKAGVLPERIRPGKPQQNGRHERMHLTVKRETASPPAATRRAQQRRFDAFRSSFNQERPHEALGQETPAEHFQASERTYSGRLREPEYAGADEVRRVHLNGDIKWQGDRVFVSLALIGEPIGLFEEPDGSYRLFYGPLALGCLDRKGKFTKDTSQPGLEKTTGRVPKVLPM